VPEPVRVAADMIFGWVRERGPQWKASRVERQRVAREAEERRIVEERAAEARREAEERAAEARREAEEREAAARRREEAARMQDLLAFLEDDADDTDDGAASNGGAGEHMKTDSRDVAYPVTASTGGTAADDEGEEEQEGEPEEEQEGEPEEEGSVPDREFATATPAKRVKAAAVASGKGGSGDKRTAAERVLFNAARHEVRAPDLRRRASS
jgi:hypothetical protein